MTANMLDRVPLDQITQQARQVKFWRSVLTLIAGLLFGLGWVTAKGFGVTWFAAVWCGCAVREGWRTGRAITPRGPSPVG